MPGATPSTSIPIPEKPHYQKLTLKQRKLVDGVVSGLTPTEAAREAYDTKNPKVIGSQVMQQEKVRNAFLIEMEKQGITNERLSSKLSEKLDAKKIHSSPTEPDKEVDDNPTQIKALQLATKLKGLHPDQKLNVNKRSASFNLTLDDKNSQELLQSYKQLHEEITNLRNN